MSRKKEINNIIPVKLAERGERLKKWWKTKGWSKVEFASKMGIWPQNVNHYFSGRLDPLNLAEQLMKEDCDVAWIIEGKAGGRQIRYGTVAETPAPYGKKISPTVELSKATRLRLDKLARLLESGPEKGDLEMLDLIIRTMEEKKRKKTG
jgi:transcriptional regulator with XRE-family HTH domain